MSAVSSLTVLDDDNQIATRAHRHEASSWTLHKTRSQESQHTCTTAIDHLHLQSPQCWTSKSLHLRDLTAATGITVSFLFTTTQLITHTVITKHFTLLEQRTSLCWASSLSSQHEYMTLLAFASDTHNHRLISAVDASAQQQPYGCRCCCRSMGQTDGRTPDCYIDPTPHTMRAASMTVNIIILLTVLTTLRYKCNLWSLVAQSHDVWRWFVLRRGSRSLPLTYAYSMWHKPSTFTHHTLISYLFIYLGLLLQRWLSRQSRYSYSFTHVWISVV